jgi:hypothetical protein
MGDHRFRGRFGAAATRLPPLSAAVVFATCAAEPVLAAPDTPAPASTAPSSAEAAARVEGRIIAFDAGDLVVDIARADGAHEHDRLELWRELRLKHPVSGRTVTDRFRIGQVRLVQVQDELSLAVPDGDLSRQPGVGDIVVFRPTHVPWALPHEPSRTPDSAAARDTSAAAGAPSAAGTGPAAAADPDARAVVALFDSLRGTTPEQRVAAYEEFAQRFPNSRFSPLLDEEARALSHLLGLTEHFAKNALPRVVSAAPPERVVAGSRFTIVVELASAEGAVMHFRSAGRGEVSDGFEAQPMQPMGNGYFRFTTPDPVPAPHFHYFVEAVAPDGKGHAVLGSAEDPVPVAVTTLDAAPGPVPVAELRVHTDYADWNNLRGNDTAWQTEGEFGMRFRDEGLRATRMGFGVYRGRGGSLEELDELGLPPRRVGLTYGYLEGEYGVSRFVGVIGRLAAGLDGAGVTSGAQLLLRLGNDRETNLLLGGEVLGGVGVRGITQIELQSIPRVLLLFRTEVTNQPAGTRARSAVAPTVPPTPPAPPTLAEDTSDVGARAIAEVGYEFFPELVLSLRGSYQGRTIRHAGPGLGGGVKYRW